MWLIKANKVIAINFFSIGLNEFIDSTILYKIKIINYLLNVKLINDGCNLINYISYSSTVINIPIKFVAVLVGKTTWSYW